MSAQLSYAHLLQLLQKVEVLDQDRPCKAWKSASLGSSHGKTDKKPDRK